jgi:hypothetical protein
VQYCLTSAVCASLVNAAGLWLAIGAGDADARRGCGVCDATRTDADTHAPATTTTPRGTHPFISVQALRRTPK